MEEKKMLKNISAIILAYNEEESIEKAINSLNSVLKQVSLKYEIIIVLYQGSTDRTEEIISNIMKKNPNLRLVYQKKQDKGYGKALKLGIKNSKYDFIFYTDADNQYDIKELEKLATLINKHDIVAGYRHKRKDPFMRLFFAKAYNLVINTFFHTNFKDVDCAFKIFKKSVLNSISVKMDSGMAVAEMMIKAKSKGFKIKEIPVIHYPRAKGNAKFVKKGGMIKLKVITELIVDMRCLWKELHTK